MVSRLPTQNDIRVRIPSAAGYAAVPADKPVIGDPGAGLQRMAAGFAKAGALFERKAEQDAVAAAAEAEIGYENAIRPMLHDPEQGYFAAQGRNALDRREPTRTDIEKTRALYGSKLTGEARRRFDLATRDSQGRVYERMDGWARQQRAGYLNDIDQAQIQSQAQEALQYADDDEALIRAVGEASLIVERSGQRNGDAPEVIRAKQLSTRSAIMAATVDRLIENGDQKSLQTAVERFRNAEPYLSDTQRGQTLRAIREAVKTYASERYRADTAALEDALKKGGLSGNARHVFDAVVSAGYPRHVAAGIIGNFIRESPDGAGGIEPDQNEHAPIVPGSRGGYGIAQWTGSRRRDLEAFAADTGGNVASIETQTEFLLHELGGKESRAAAALREAGTPEEAARVFEEMFERSGVKAIKDRQDNARRVMIEADSPSDPLLDQLDTDDIASLRKEVATAEGVRLKVERDETFDAMDLAASLGKLREADVLTARTRSGRPLDNGDKAMLIRRIGERKASDASADDFARRLANGETFNPFGAEDKKGADAYAGRVLEVLDQAGTAARDPSEVPPRPMQTLASLAISSGVASKQLVAMTRQGMGGSPDEQMEALSMAASILAHKPKAFERDGGAEIVRAADRFKASIELGANPHTALLAAVPADPDAHRLAMDRAKKAYDEDAGKGAAFSPSKLAAGIAEIQGRAGWLTSGAGNLDGAVTAQLVSDARDIYAEEFVANGGNSTLTEQVVKQRLARVYGVTQADGSGKLMKDAPELYWPADPLTGDHAYLNEQITGLLKETEPTWDEGGFILTRAPIDRNGLPTYYIQFEDDEGFPRISVKNSGEFASWQPDFQAAVAAKSDERGADYEARRNEAARDQQQRRRRINPRLDYGLPANQPEGDGQ